eukprot:6491965-Amphidinium_carterae.2
MQELAYLLNDEINSASHRVEFGRHGPLVTVHLIPCLFAHVTTASIIALRSRLCSSAVPQALCLYKVLPEYPRVLNCSLSGLLA